MIRVTVWNEYKHELYSFQTYTQRVFTALLLIFWARRTTLR